MGSTVSISLVFCSMSLVSKHFFLMFPITTSTHIFFTAYLTYIFGIFFASICFHFMFPCGKMFRPVTLFTRSKVTFFTIKIFGIFQHFFCFQNHYIWKQEKCLNLFFKKIFIVTTGFFQFEIYCIY